MSELLENLQSFREETSKSDNTRYYSWIDCNLVFRQKKTADDVLAKELFMFLASWGMLRNSFLLNHNRRILLPVINLLKDPRFKILQNASIDTVEANASLIITLKNELFSCLNSLKNKGDKNITVTLISKIITGAFACSVAYDKNVCSALKARGICQTLNKKSILELCTFYKEHPELEKMRLKIQTEDGIDYPPMKILDMAFWKSGEKK
ncbi:hypothetical protein [Treponema pedis]|uniref:hypothetical protein n=1 Tax=Treponema pedis TaxID=409322 RepID=UPI003D1BB227